MIVNRMLASNKYFMSWDLCAYCFLKRKWHDCDKARFDLCCSNQRGNVTKQDWIRNMLVYCSTLLISGKSPLVFVYCMTFNNNRFREKWNLNKMTAKCNKGAGILIISLKLFMIVKQMNREWNSMGCWCDHA